MIGKRRLGLSLYLVLIGAMCYSGWQLSEQGVKAEEEGAGVCCAYSTDCGGKQLCYLPGDKAPCCGPGRPCMGPNYCLDPPLAD